jgi:hypothetical protein
LQCRQTRSRFVTSAPGCSGQAHAVEQLLAKRAKVNLVGTLHNNTMLHFAAIKCERNPVTSDTL